MQVNVEIKANIRKKTRICGINNENIYYHPLTYWDFFPLASCQQLALVPLSVFCEAKALNGTNIWKSATSTNKTNNKKIVLIP